MEPNFIWIYLVILFMIPLARIIPRMISKRKQNAPIQKIPEKRPQQNLENADNPNPNQKPRTKNMLVLGALNRRLKTFSSIQKETGLESHELDAIFKELEEKGLLTIRQKQGMFGTKIELLPTEKGFKEYYS